MFTRICISNVIVHLTYIDYFHHLTVLSGKQKKLLKSIHYLSDTIKRFIDECPEYSEKSESNFNVSLHYGSMNREGLITPKLSRYRLSDTSGCTPKLDIISTDGAASHPMNCSEPQQKTFVPGMFVRYDEPLVRTKLSTRGMLLRPYEALRNVKDNFELISSMRPFTKPFLRKIRERSFEV